MAVVIISVPANGYWQIALPVAQDRWYRDYRGRWQGPINPMGSFREKR